MYIFIYIYGQIAAVKTRSPLPPPSSERVSGPETDVSMGFKQGLTRLLPPLWSSSTNATVLLYSPFVRLNKAVTAAILYGPSLQSFSPVKQCFITGSYSPSLRLNKASLPGPTVLLSGPSPRLNEALFPPLWSFSPVKRGFNTVATVLLPG